MYFSMRTTKIDAKYHINNESAIYIKSPSTPLTLIKNMLILFIEKYIYHFIMHYFTLFSDTGPTRDVECLIETPPT